MRQINKRQPMVEYAQSIKHSKATDWKQLAGGIRSEVASYILKNEQQMLSAYTEKVLSDDNANLHVDHFVKQNFLKPTETLEWSNLFADEHSGIENYGSDYKDNNKNTPIKSKKDNLKLINPATENPHFFFQYSAQGEITPRWGLSDNDKERAELTSKAFNLNHPSLIAERHDYLHQIIAMKQGGMTAIDIKSIFLNSPYQYSYPSLVEYFCNECFENI